MKPQPNTPDWEANKKRLLWKKLFTSVTRVPMFTLLIGFSGIICIGTIIVAMIFSMFRRTEYAEDMVHDGFECVSQCWYNFFEYLEEQ